MEQLGTFIINHWELWGALLVVFLLILINEAVAKKNQAKTLSPSEVVELMNHNDIALFDLRDTEAFRTGHIIGSKRVSSAEFAQKYAAQYKDKPFILVCARGVQAASLANQLQKNAFEQPMVLAGGITAWVEANLPLVKNKGKGKKHQGSSKAPKVTNNIDEDVHHD